jgi:hypothetical protein
MKKPNTGVHVVIPPLVAGEPCSAEYTVTVNGMDVPVYTARVDEGYRTSPLVIDETYSFSGFDCSGPVDVVVWSCQPLTALSIRSCGGVIEAKLDGRSASFTLEQNGNFLIERNGNGRKDPLLLFANPIEENPPREGDPGVVYFAPGRHDAGTIELHDHETLYLAGGALVTGRVVAKGDHIRIMGRGILENEGELYSFKKMIQLDECKRARIEGIIIRKNSLGWTVVPERCDGVVISNIKICGSYRGNDDGIDPVNTRDMLVEDCFIRTKDDCFAFKGMDDEGKSNCEDITVTRCMFWSDQCCAVLLGDESRAAFMRNITIRDCFIPYLSHEGYPKKFLMLHAGEDMRLEHVFIENITIGGEGQDHNYIELACEFNQWCKTETVGSIRDIRLRNVHLNGKEGGYFIVMKGHDAEYGIEEVTFDNCTINGAAITADYGNLQLDAFVRKIRFDSDSQRGE